MFSIYFIFLLADRTDKEALSRYAKSMESHELFSPLVWAALICALSLYRVENTVEESTVGYISVSMISVIGGKSELGKGTSVNLSTKRHYFGYLVQNDFLV